MYKSYFKVFITACLCFATYTMSAQEKTGKSETTETTANTEDFAEVQISELPQAITEAVTRDFAGATINKAFVNKSKEYKLVLQTEAADEAQTVYANENGEWIEP